jgi:hypothetical protein
MAERNARNDPAAFCLDDIQFKGANSRPLTHSAVCPVQPSACLVSHSPLAHAEER